MLIHVVVSFQDVGYLRKQMRTRLGCSRDTPLELFSGLSLSTLSPHHLRVCQHHVCILFDKLLIISAVYCAFYSREIKKMSNKIKAISSYLRQLEAAQGSAMAVLKQAVRFSF
jgi:hypothetical protein